MIQNTTYKALAFLFFSIVLPAIAFSANPPRTTINLNGSWDFEQTTTAWKPATFTRKVPVPGLVHLALPKIKEYDKFFKRPAVVNAKMEHSVYNIDYTPRYSWYKKKVFVAKDLQDQEAVLTIKKSQYVTQVFVNGIELGSFIECYTPIEVAITRALKFGSENEIVIKVGDRYWLPSAAAGGTDKEKEHYLPGIWDDVLLSFTDKIRVNKVLLLPNLKQQKVMVKMLLWNLHPAQIFYGGPMKDSVSFDITIIEKKSKKPVATYNGSYVLTRDRNTQVEAELSLKDAHAWTPEDPFLYTAEISVQYKGKKSDAVQKHFGMRDFETKGKFFHLNRNKYFLRGSNITLQRFFEDPDCGNLVWNREWVKKMLIDIPKELDWNAMRICVGVVPDFWYELADEYGLLFQNEWLYWQNHGWNEQIRKEYTDWVWSDGSHPSIVIWDGINENWDDFIGNELIPEMKKLDPTRIWDAGYMTSTSMKNDDMDEPHPYQGHQTDNGEPYPLGDLNYKPGIIKDIEASAVPQLVNEYGWIWLWRDGTPSKLTLEVYDKYLGKKATATERRNFQAYWLQLETEWLRSNNHIAGVLAFCYLTNNYGYTGDWFVGNIKDLKPSPVLKVFKHAFAPTNVFINLADERYNPSKKPHKAGSQLDVQLVGVNDAGKEIEGEVEIALINAAGKKVSNNKQQVVLPATARKEIGANIILPELPGGYVIETYFTPKNDTKQTKTSRRFIKVGQADKYLYYDLKE